MIVLGAGLVLALSVGLRQEESEDSQVVGEEQDETGMTSEEREDLMRVIGYVQQ